MCGRMSVSHRIATQRARLGFMAGWSLNCAFPMVWNGVGANVVIFDRVGTGAGALGGGFRRRRRGGLSPPAWVPTASGGVQSPRVGVPTASGGWALRSGVGSDDVGCLAGVLRWGCRRRFFPSRSVRVGVPTASEGGPESSGVGADGIFCRVRKHRLIRRRRRRMSTFEADGARRSGNGGEWGLSGASLRSRHLRGCP